MAESSLDRLGQKERNLGKKVRNVQKPGQIMVPGHAQQGRNRERNLQKVRAGPRSSRPGVSSTSFRYKQNLMKRL